MKKQAKYLVEFIVNSNLWIAIATVSFYELTLVQFGKEIELNVTSFLLFFSTLFVYNLFRILSPKDDCKTWYAKNYSYTKFLSGFSFIGLLISLFFFDKQYLPIIVLSGILSFLYASPFIRLGKNSFSLRKFWFLKSIIVAVVWVLSTAVLPMLENNISLSNSWMFLLEKFLFILGITIPYDIKDLKADEYDGIKTLAIKFGVKRTKLISNFILIVGLVLALSLFSQNIIPIGFVYIVAMFLNYKLDETKDEFWYTFLIDGTIILYFLSVWIYSK